MTQSRWQFGVWALRFWRSFVANIGINLLFTAIASTFVVVGGIAAFVTENAWLSAIFFLFLYVVLNTVIAVVENHQTGGSSPLPVWNPQTVTSWATVLAAGGLTALAIIAVIRGHALDDANPWLIVLLVAGLALLGTVVAGLLRNGIWSEDAELVLGVLSSIAATIGLLGFLISVGAFDWLTNPWWWVFLLLLAFLGLGAIMAWGEDEAGEALFIICAALLVIFMLTFLVAHGEAAWLFFSLLAMLLAGSLVGEADVADVGVVVAGVGMVLMLILYLVGAL
jgi:hypothetical protein